MISAGGCRSAGSSLARIGARLDAREHDLVDGAQLATLAASLMTGAGLGEAGAAVLARASFVGGDLKESGFFSVKGFLVDAAQV